MYEREAKERTSPNGSGKPAEDFFRMTRPEYRKGEMKTCSHDETQRFVE